MININLAKPSILIYYSNKINDLIKFDELLWGIEEEGIPYDIKAIEEDDFIKLAYLASQKSKLSVGLGIDSFDNISLTYNKLSCKEYLYKMTLKDSDEKLRNMGANSARLVKKIPFK